MGVTERATSVGAVIAALSTLACCLLFGFLGAIGLAGISIRAQTARPWLLGSALVLLGSGFFQLYGGRNQCRRRSPITISMFWVSVAIVLIILLFPQAIASLFAG